MTQKSPFDPPSQKPHVHAAVIKAWADGAEVQYRPDDKESWRETSTPGWNPHAQYRVKPEIKVYEKFVEANGVIFSVSRIAGEAHNLLLTLEDGKLVDAKVI